MAAKAKIKVVTEEIKEDKPVSSDVEVKDVESTKPDEAVETPEASVNEAKLTSFSTLDVKADEPLDVKSESTADSETTKVESIDEKPSEDSQPSTQLSSTDVKAWLNDVRPDTSKEMEKGGKSGFKIFLILFLLLVAMGLAVGGFYYYKNSSSEPKEKSETKVETPVQTATPEPTKVSIDIKKYSVNVLNGSGVSGEAKKVSDMLVSKGFNEAKTGNASKTDFTKTEVALKKDLSEDVFNTIKDTLGGTYDVIKAEKPLDDKSTYDIVVTVGQKKS